MICCTSANCDLCIMSHLSTTSLANAAGSVFAFNAVNRIMR